MELNITVPNKIVLKGESIKREVSLENCYNQHEIIEYLKLYIYISAISDNKIAIDDAAEVFKGFQGTSSKWL